MMVWKFKMVPWGRLLYVCFHRPFGHAKRIVRQGVLRTARARRGRAELTRSVESFLAAPEAMVPSGPSLGVPVVYLAGRTTLDLLVTSLASLYGVVTPTRVSVISDGTLSPAVRAQIEKRFPRLRCVLPEQIEQSIEETLPRNAFPGLRSLRDTFILARKLVDVQFAEPSWYVFVDADTVFLKCPDEIIEWAADPRTPRYLVDQNEAYGVKPSELWEVAERSTPAPVNSGLFLFNGAEVDWSFVERLISTLNLVERRTHHTEQAIFAALFARTGATPLSASDYISSPTHVQSDGQVGVFHHYVAPRRYAFYAGVWERYLASECGRTGA